MIDNKEIPGVEIAKKLGLRQGKNGNWHCFNSSAHNNQDQHPSLSIGSNGQGFYCHACGRKGNNLELIKQVLNVNYIDATKWLNDNFNLAGNLNIEEKYQIRLIRKNGQRFIFLPKNKLNLKEPTEQDCKHIKDFLGKAYSLATLKKANVNMSHGSGKYGIVFPKGQIIYNPLNNNNFIHLEGRTDLLTAIELQLDKNYGLISEYNKTSSINIEGGTHIFILDKDVSPDNIRKRIQFQNEAELKFIRLSEHYKDLSDFYNKGNCKKEDILNLINSAPVDNIKFRKLDTSHREVIFEIGTAQDLQFMELPDTNWAIKEFLPEGLTILAGRPKSGKSWLALNLCLAIAMGGKALSFYDLEQGESLYIGLEDTRRRLQNRLKMLYSNEPFIKWSEDFQWMLNCDNFSNGGEEQLRSLIESKPRLKLITIDTFEKFVRRNGRETYSEDYGIAARLQSITLEYQIAMLVIHHTRKMQTDYDLDDVSGTSGLTGAADTIMVLKRTNNLNTLFITGRDIEEKKYAMDFDKTTGLWNITGEVNEVIKSNEQNEIVNLLKTNSMLSIKDISSMLEINYNAIAKRLQRMYSSGILEKTNDKKYYIKDGVQCP